MGVLIYTIFMLIAYLFVLVVLFYEGESKFYKFMCIALVVIFAYLTIKGIISIISLRV